MNSRQYSVDRYNNLAVHDYIVNSAYFWNETLMLSHLASFNLVLQIQQSGITFVAIYSLYKVKCRDKLL